MTLEILIGFMLFVFVRSTMIVILPLIESAIAQGQLTHEGMLAVPQRNGSGRLTTYQICRLAVRAVLSLSDCLIFAVPTIVLVLVGLWFMAIPCAAIVAAKIWYLFVYTLEMVTGQVNVVEGPVATSYWWGRGGPESYCKIQNKVFFFPGPIRKQLRKGEPYRVYFTPRSMMFLAIEPVYDTASSSGSLHWSSLPPQL
jgi:hypothetical protein